VRIEGFTLGRSVEHRSPRGAQWGRSIETRYRRAQTLQPRNKIVASGAKELQASRQPNRHDVEAERLKGLGSSMLDEKFREVTRGVTWMNR